MDLSKLILVMDCSQPVLCAFLGALVGGQFTLWGVEKSHRLDLDKSREEEGKLIKSFKQMICTEVETLWTRYQETMGKHIEALQDNQPLLMVFPVSQEYFTVYNNNTVLLGKIEDQQLCRLIVEVYSRAKGLLDSFRMNNELAVSYAQTKFNEQNYQNPIYIQLAKQQLEGLIQYAALIRQEHNRMKELIRDLMGRIKQN